MLNRVLLKINFDSDTTWSPSFIVGEIVEKRHFMTEEFPILMFHKICFTMEYSFRVYICSYMEKFSSVDQNYVL